ncbi:hypothetical protein NEOC84_000957|uniref:hypothetical protein n=1 Tax=Neochlamydia sp. AcF84 TaxID=2315858 RepID=UPI00140B662C|nr:hypothetical protein [Neochlamydia sp. AcF84]NGY95049.1 hypothetical protein [Neochlamydia sp. AcF84]
MIYNERYFSYIATPHYVKLNKSGEGGLFSLKRGWIASKELATIDERVEERYLQSRLRRKESKLNRNDKKA